MDWTGSHLSKKIFKVYGGISKIKKAPHRELGETHFRKKFRPLEAILERKKFRNWIFAAHMADSPDLAFGLEQSKIAHFRPKNPVSNFYPQCL